MSNFIVEALILGISIFLGLSSIKINVSVNVTDKPITTSVESANIHNVDRGAGK